MVEITVGIMVGIMAEKTVGLIEEVAPGFKVLGGARGEGIMDGWANADAADESVNHRVRYSHQAA